MRSELADEALRSEGGQLLLRHLRDEAMRTEQDILQRSRNGTSTLDEIRYRTGLLDGVQLAINALENARKGRHG